MQPIFTDWKSFHSELFANHLAELKHSLVENGLFSDDAIAELIERTPREDYHVSTMDPQSHDPRSRREGVIDGLTGRQVLEAVNRGHIWLNLRNPNKYLKEYDDLLTRIYAEIDDNLGEKTFKQQMTILVSSPNVRVGYHCDVPGQTLWQVRGKKRVYVYPNRSPFLPQDGLEKILLGRAHEVSLNFQPWFDEHARIFELEPGYMLTWPHNAPHRIENHDCLNISVTTEHWTNRLRDSYAVNYSNGLLRSTLGLKSLSQSTETLGFYPKLALAAAHKLSGLQKTGRHAFRIDFKVDPESAGGFVNIPAYELSH